MCQTIISDAFEDRECTRTCPRPTERCTRCSSKWIVVCLAMVIDYFLLFFFQSLNLCTAFILYVLSSDTLTSGIAPSTVRLMIELVKKSPSSTIDDEEYKKMKQRILTIVNKSLQEDIFYEQRFNVRTERWSTRVGRHLSFRHVILFLKRL